MTPLITEMIQLSPTPEKSTWFDLGQMSRSDNASVQSDVIMKLPYENTGIVGIDKDGVKFALWLSGSEETVTVGGVSKNGYVGVDGRGAFGHYFDPFSYTLTPEGIGYYTGDQTIDEKDVKQLFRMTCACLVKLHNCTQAHQPAIKANSLTNKRRMAKGKPPLIYDWHTINLELARQKTSLQGGTHATPRRHQCRGHWRNCKLGKRVWVKECWKGDASKGTIFKDYKSAGSQSAIVEGEVK